MKIAIYHNLPSGGAKRAANEIARHLVARGHKLWEFCPSSAVLDFLPLAPYCVNSFVFDINLQPLFRRWVPLMTPYVNLGRHLINQRRANELALRVARTVDSMKFDLVLAHDCLVAENPHILRYLTTPTVFYCHHGARSHMPQAPNRRQRSSTNGEMFAECKRNYYGIAESINSYSKLVSARTNAQAADLVFTNSYFSRECLYVSYGVDASVVYYGIDTSTFYPLKRPHEEFVLAVGALHPFKGYDFLFESLGQIPLQNRPMLVIAANHIDTEYEQHLKQTAESLGVSFSIRTIWNDEELMQLYNEALALVYTPVMEPFGLVALEAMACGVPVIAVREGGVRESVQDGITGLLTDRDTIAFSNALQRIISDTDLRQRLRNAGPQYVSANWNWSRTIDKMETLWDTLL